MKKLLLIAAAIIMIAAFSKNCFSQSNRLWATYYGGSDGDFGGCSVVDPSGNIFMSGNTYSTTGFASGGFQNTYGGGFEDAYLVKFSATGNRLWATYYGGTDNDEGNRVTVDSAGNAYLIGTTLSFSGIASGGYQNSQAGGTDAFLVKFDAAGNRVWGTYFGGSGNEYGYDVKADDHGNVYLTGRTSSSSAIASGGFQNTYGGGGNDAFLAKFNATGSLLWSTYYGGTGDDQGFGIAIDKAGFVYLAGITNSSGGIASGGFQNALAGGYDDFLVKFDSLGNRIWATYYGGAGDENGGFLNTDISANIYYSGNTTSSSGIASGGFQNTYGGGAGDAFLVKFSASGGRLWATYYGGTGTENCGYVNADLSGSVYISGTTNSTSGIASGGFQNSLIGSTNVFLAAFDPSGNRLCATYYGQSGEFAGHPSVDGSGYVYLAGSTNSSAGIASGGFSNTFGGYYDAFLVKFSPCFTTLNATFAIISLDCPGQCTASASATAFGGTQPYSYVWNTSPPQTTLTADSLCPGTYTVTITDNTGNSVTANVVITNYPAPAPTISVIPSPHSLHCNQSFNSYQWYLDGSIIAGATNQDYIPTQNANYSVEVIDGNGCSGMSVKYGVDWLGIAEIKSENDILIFPNPAYDIITILSPQRAIINISNEQGQLIKICTTNGNKSSFDISAIPCGVYIVQAKTEKEIVIKKFVKE